MGVTMQKTALLIKYLGTFQRGARPFRFFGKWAKIEMNIFLSKIHA